VSVEFKFGSLEYEKIIIGSLQVHTGYLTFSLKKNCSSLHLFTTITTQFVVQVEI